MEDHGEAAGHPAPAIRSKDDVTFASGSAQLAGAVLVPRATGPHPALVLVHDGGDRTARELRPLAAALARAGIAALIYDKRGVGDSTGDWRAGDFAQLAADALAGVRFLAAQPSIDPARVGLLGIGEGGWVVPLAAARAAEVAFVVTIGAAATTPIEQERFRRVYDLRRAGAGNALIALYSALWLLVCAVWRRLPDRATAPPSARRYFARVCAFDPLPVWRQVRQPLLALWGERDDRVPPHGSAWLLRRVLRAGGHANSRVVIVPGAGHALAFPGDATSAAAPATAALVAHWLLPG